MIPYYFEYEANNESSLANIQSKWLIFTNKNTPWKEEFKEIGYKKVEVNKNTPLWTDKHNNVLSVLK